MNSNNSDSKFKSWNSQIAVRLGSYSLVAILLVCVAVALAWLIEYIFPDWNSSYLPWATFAFSLEAMYYRRIIRQKKLSLFDREFWLHRGAELVVLVLFVRIFLYIVNGVDQFIQDFQGWPKNWYLLLDDGEFLGVTLFLTLVWGISNLFGADLDHLQTHPNDIHWDTISELDLDRKEARNQLVGRMLSLGMVLILVTVIVRLNAGQILGETGFSRAATLNLLVYFGICVVLFSFTQFALLHGRWYWENTPIDGNIGVRWVRYGMIFAGILIILAILLPTMYTTGLLESIRFLLSLIGYLITLIYFLYTALIALLYGILSSFSGREVMPQTLELPNYQLPGKLLNPNDQMLIDIPIINWLLSLIFWITLLIVIGISLTHYFKQNSELFLKIKTMPVITWVLSLFEWLFAAFVGLGGHLKQSVINSIHLLSNPLREDVISRSSYLSLRKLGSREKIIFYYLAFLRRSRDIGAKREPHVTPNMFRNKLAPLLPDDARQATSTLTEAFYTARYSSRQVTPEDVTPALSAWKKLRQYFRKLRKNV
jgi:hypothetical protein